MKHGHKSLGTGINRQTKPSVDKHVKKAHASVTGSGVGSNLKLPDSKFAVHVAQKKDNMAGNVGGGAHMMPDKKAMGFQKLQESGGPMKGVKNKTEKY